MEESLTVRRGAGPPHAQHKQSPDASQLTTTHHCHCQSGCQSQAAKKAKIVEDTGAHKYQRKKQRPMNCRCRRQSQSQAKDKAAEKRMRRGRRLRLRLRMARSKQMKRPMHAQRQNLKVNPPTSYAQDLMKMMKKTTRRCLYSN